MGESLTVMSGELPHGVDAISRWLDERQLPYELVEHPEAFAAADEARAAGVDPHAAVKTLALHDRGGYRLCVIPALRRLDLHRVRDLLEGTRHLRLATEEEMARDFPAFEVGALPPFGPLLLTPELVDIRVLYSERILCSAGDHRHSLSIDPRDLVRVAEPVVADVCERTSSVHDEDIQDLPRL